jgi:hypothetical protein
MNTAVSAFGPLTRSRTSATVTGDPRACVLEVLFEVRCARGAPAAYPKPASISSLLRHWGEGHISIAIAHKWPKSS